MTKEIQIVEGPVERLDTYASIPISFVIKSRLDLDQLWLGEYAEIKIPEKTKDYDALEPISTLAERFDTAKWRMFSAVVTSNDQGHVAGGAIVAWNTPVLDMLDGRQDLSVLWDIRVHPLFRGQGIGRTLFERAKAWSKHRQCTEMRVETQNTNVAACRFYRQMGCRLHSIQEDAYEGLDEAKIIWTTKV